MKEGSYVRVKQEWLEKYNKRYNTNKKQKPYLVKKVIEDLKGNKFYKIGNFEDFPTKDMIFEVYM